MAVSSLEGRMQHKQSACQVTFIQGLIARAQAAGDAAPNPEGSGVAAARRLFGKLSLVRGGILLPLAAVGGRLQ